jgi:protocatechuate 3,4-dioxygenase beta subunit
MARLGTLIVLILLLVTAMLFWQHEPAAPVSSGLASNEQPQGQAATGDRLAADGLPADRTQLELDANAPHYTVRGVVLGDAHWPDLSKLRVLAYAGAAHDAQGLLSGAMAGSPRRKQQPAFLLSGDAIAETTLDATGHFELHTRTRHLRITIDHDLYLLATPEIVHVSSQTRNADIVLAPMLGGMVRGRLLGERRDEVEQVKLSLEVDPVSALRDAQAMMAALLAPTRPAAIPAADHSFVFRAVAPAARLSFSAQGGRASAKAMEPGLQPGEVRDVIVAVQTSAQLSVQVVDEAGHGIAGASVSARSTEQQGMTAMLQSRHATCDERGKCQFESMVAGSYQLNAMAAGRTGESKTVQVAVEPSAEAVQIVLREGGIVTGIVQTTDGQPVPDARVAHHASENIPILGDMTEQLGPDYLSQVTRGGAATDAAGRFRLTGLNDNSAFLVVAAHTDYSAGVARDVHMGDVDVVVTLQPHSTVRGRVLAADSNEHVPQFTVAILRTSFLVLKTPIAREVVESSDGSFELTGISADSYTLQIDADGYGTETKSITVQKGTHLDVGAIALQPAATIRGKVQDEQGQPIANAMVRKRQGAMADNPMLAMMLGASDRVHSDAEGNFELTPITPGRVQLLANATGFASGTSERLQLEAGQRLEGVVIELGHGGTIHGRIASGPNQQPSDFMLLAQHQVSQNTTTGDIQPDGTFVIDNLDPGSYQVQAMAQALLRSVQSFEPKPGESLNIGKMMKQMTDGVTSQRCTVRAGEVTEVELDVGDLTVGAQWLVRVEIGGKPLQNGIVEAVAMDSGTLRIAMLDHGVATFARMQAGAHRLQVRSGLTMTPVGAPQDLEYPAGAQEHSALISLPGGELVGRVIDAATDEPLNAAIVRLHHDGEAEQDDPIGMCLSNANGEFTFTGLADGIYSLIAAEPFGSNGNSKASRQAGIAIASGTSNAPVVLRSQPAAGASVFVASDDGRKIAGATVLCVDAEGRPLSGLGIATTGQDGRAWFGGMANGQARIVGRAPGFAPGASDLQQLTAAQSTTFQLILGSGAATRLSVVDANGTRLRGVSLTAKFDDSPWLPAMLMVQTIALDGTLDLGRLGPGNWTFRVTHPAVGTVTQQRTIRGSSAVTVVISK